MNGPVPEPMRKDTFRALVEAQDRGQEVDDSRQSVAAYFGIQLPELQVIEYEGINKTWPPL